jgi:hypothetical protein
MSEIIASMSYSAVGMDLPRSNGWDLVMNANPTGLTTEQIEMGTWGTAYVPDLIKRRRERYHSREHRFAVVTSDPIAIFVGERYIEEMCGKPFKSYDVDIEGNPDEVMMDLWERWDQLKANEPLQAFYSKISYDGYCLARLMLEEMGSYSYKAYGFFESPPDYWKRINMRGTRFHNVIYQYYVNYIPRPNGFEYMGNYNVHAEEEWLSPMDPGFFHFYRKLWNKGVGRPRIQGIWASLTMLRKISFADYRRSSIFNTFLYPEDWDAEKGLEEMIEAASRADEMTGIAMPMRVNPLTKEVEEWPRFFDRTMDQTGAMPRADASAGGTLLRNSEYARVLIALGYTETKLVGSQPGEVTGSKLDLTRDDEVDIREFQFVVPMIKQMNLWFLENGFLEGLEAETLERVMNGDYEIKCHVEWEVLENQVREAELAAEEMENQAEGQAARQNSAMKWNSAVEEALIHAFITNSAMPMTPVMSSWLKRIGFSDSQLFMETHEGYKYQKPRMDAEMQYHQWTQSGSKGGYYWDNFVDRAPPWQRIGGFPSHLEGGYGEGYDWTESEATKEHKIEGAPKQGILGAGLTREPLKAKFPKTQKSSKGGKKMDQPAKRKTKGSSRPTPAIGDVAAIRSAGTTPAIRRHAAIDDLSFSKANAMMTEASGEGMSSKTWARFKKMLDLFEVSNNFRVNSEVIGNPMSFDVVLKYNTPKGVSNELVCKKEWQKIVAHEGDLYLYEDLKHGGRKYNVGQYKYWYDDDKDEPVTSYNREEVYNSVRELLDSWDKKNTRMYNRMLKGLPLSLSTEYYCKTIKHNGKLYQTEFHDGHGEPTLKGIAVVDIGNCDEPFCNFEVIDD